MKVASALLVLAGLALLAGCQGVSAGSNAQQQQYGTLYLPQTLNFGTVAAGSSSTLTLTATNPGPGAVTVSSATISTQYFSLTAPSLPVTIASGQTATINIAFSPNATGTFDATLTVASNATNAQTSVSLSGTGSSVTTPPGQLSASPATIPVGNVAVGSSGTGSGSLEASGEPVIVTAASSNNSAFSISGLSFPVTISAGQSVPFTVTFTPQSAGSASATLSFTSNAETSPTTETVTGTGTSVANPGQLSVSPGTIPVGSVVVGTSGTASGSLMANGASVTVTSDSSNNSAFSISGLSFPVTIPAGESVPFTVTFTPQTTGAASATLSFTSNAQTSPTTAALTGTGTAAPTYTVDLSWNADSSPDISGYNIYRAVYTTSCGSFAKINTSLNAGTTYTDTVVQDGTNYCYATTAVNTSNQESGYSNIVPNVQIPAP